MVTIRDGHHIVTEGDEMGLRFAVALPPAIHQWMDDCENCDATLEPQDAG